jgi:hypothetical protein
MTLVVAFLVLLICLGLIFHRLRMDEKDTEIEMLRHVLRLQRDQP